MPQVDLETLVSACAGGGSDRKLTCETLADDNLSKKQEHAPETEVPPDFPPESFWLSKDAEVDWFDRNAFFERKESTKGISTSANINSNSNSNPNSQRFSVKVKKTSLFGLPKTQKPNYVGTSKRRNNKPTNIKLFPKRSSSVGKTAVSVAEPTSPKVSCMGRVRSRRCSRRSNDISNNKREKSIEKSRSQGKKGFWLFSMFKSCRNGIEPVGQEIERIPEEGPPRKSVTVRMPEFPVSGEPVPEPPGLGGLKKFASGRRSGSWSTDDPDVAASHLVEVVPQKEVD